MKLTFADKLRIALALAALWMCACRHTRSEQLTQVDYQLVQGKTCPEGWQYTNIQTIEPTPRGQVGTPPNEVWCYRVRPTSVGSRGAVPPAP